MRRKVVLSCLCCFPFISALSATRLAIPPEGVAFGEIAAGEILEKSIDLRNVSSAPIAVSQVKPCCGAEATLSAMRIAPGTATTLSVSLKPQLPGEFSKSVRIYCDDPESPIYVIPVTGSAVESKSAIGGMLSERGISDVALLGGPVGGEMYSYLAAGFNFKGIFEMRNAASAHECRSSNGNKSRRRSLKVAHVFLDAGGSESSAEGIAVKPDRKAMAMASINCLLSRILLPSRQTIDVRVTPIIVGLDPSGYSGTSM